MKAAYRSNHNRLYCGDALLVLRKLPTGSVDAVIADPPYCSGGTTTVERTTLSTRRKYISAEAKHTLPDFSGDQRDQRSYIYWCTLWLAEALRLTRPGGVCLVFCDWRQFPATSDALQAAGWRWRGVVVWHKPSARPQRGRFTNATEYVLWGSRGAMGAGAGQRCLAGLYTAAPPRGVERMHLTQKPLRLLRHLVQIAPVGSTILDPFMGSGTTGVAAVLEGHRFIGVELSSHFAEQAAVRIGAAERDIEVGQASTAA